MKKNIRWLLTEANLSGLNPNVVNYQNGKLICYHLTSHKKWAQYNEWVDERLRNPIIKYPKQERSADDSRAKRILKDLKDANRFSAVDIYDIEEAVIMDMIDDPYTDTSGFNPGDGDYHGKGLYTCYKFNPEIARIYGDICLAFEIDISNFLIFFEDLAKQVHGKNWTLRDQLIKLYSQQTELKENLDKFISNIDALGVDNLILPKDINEERPAINTSDYSQLLRRKLYNKTHSVSDGIVLFGRGDGPVCVSFYPKYDARLIGLGKLNKDRPDVVDWYDSLNDFVGGRAKLKQDFETLNAIAEENTDPKEKNVGRKISRICRSGWKNLTSYYKNGDYNTKKEIINYAGLVDDLNSEFTMSDISNNEINGEKEKIDILLEIIAENIKASNSYSDILENLHEIFQLIDRKVPDVIILKASEEVKKMPRNSLENYNLIDCLYTHINKFDYSSNPIFKDAINVIQDKYNETININKAKFDKVLNDLEENKATQDFFNISNLFHNHIHKDYIKKQSKEWKINLLSLIIQNIKSNPKFKKIKDKVARGLAFITGLDDVQLNTEDQLALLYGSGNNALFLLDNPNMDQTAYREYLNYALDTNNNKIFAGIRYSINFYKFLYQDRVFLKNFIEKSQSAIFKFIISNFIDVLKGGGNFYVDHHWVLSEDIDYKMQLRDIVDANNIEWFRYLTETIRTKTDSGKTKKAEKLFKELDSIMLQKNVSQEVSEPALDLSHRKIVGKSLKEVYRF